jgi:hypothetical protein
MKISDWIMIIAVLLAPLVAVQVQKILERYRETSNRRLNVFKTLMATRAATTSPQHVQALNMIDLEFQGDKYKGITDAWKTYLDHLYHYPKEDPNQQPVWEEKRNELLSKLLIEMGKPLGYYFDEVHVKRGIYTPQAHTVIETEMHLIRNGLVRLLHGQSNLKMDVINIPVTEEFVNEQNEFRKGLRELINGQRNLRVSVLKSTEE